MLELDTVTFAPLDGDEASLLAGLARFDTSFEGLLRSAARAQFLRAVTGPSLGAVAERGLAIAEACAMLMLAAYPPSDEGELRAKAIVLRRHSSGVMELRPGSGPVSNATGAACAARRAPSPGTKGPCDRPHDGHGVIARCCRVLEGWPRARRA